MNSAELYPLSFLWEQLEKVVIFLERSSVQSQLVVLSLSWFLGWLGARLWRRWLVKRFPQYREILPLSQSFSLRHYFCFCFPVLWFTLWNIITTFLLQIYWNQQDWPSAFLATGLQIYLIYFVYKILIFVLLLFLPIQTVRSQERSFFLPVFLFFSLTQFANLIFELPILMQVKIIELFGAPLTLGALIISTIGLYIWCSFINFFQTVSLHILEFFKQSDSSSLRAALILSRYFLIGLGVVVIFGYIGVNATAFAAVTGGLSVGVGFGLKEVFSNFISGIILLFERSLKPGDLIDVEGKLGIVQTLNMRATTVKILGDNSEKIIPNQTFFTTNVTTYTGSDRLIRYSLAVGAGYDCDPDQVLALLLDIARSHPEVLTVPAPTAFLSEFADSAINYTLNFSLADPTTRLRVKSDLSRQIWRRFKEEGISIPYPQRDLHLIRD
ncbi:MAG: mechanosensitive ion channel domain-containing protein [Cyanobacteriota bacterium]|nr:mechanosensitive ion channel domain-containing protein [Cyanobacteriota bacterium]